MPGLTAAQLEQFQQLGVVLCQDVFEPRDLQLLIDELYAAVAAAAVKLQQRDGALVLHAADGAPFDRQLALLCRGADQAVGPLALGSQGFFMPSDVGAIGLCFKMDSVYRWSGSYGRSERASTTRPRGCSEC